MRILVACEESQAVTKAFRALGHKAFSCDIFPCSGGHPEWHIQKDVLPLLKLRSWDMIIAFPPCTDLSASGAMHFKKKRKDGRQQKSIDFFMQFANAPCPKIAIENPVGIMSSVWRKPNQIIQPWQFGHEAQKSTCLWLKGLPPLTPTKIVEKGKFFEWVDGKTGKLKRQPLWYAEAWRLPPPERAKVRSKTFPGIAAAMAEQWGGIAK